jgi:aryl sulfotransferase
MLPKLLHTYQHHHMDSTRWQYFVPREDDIVISTSIKSGTTLTQEIVRQLVLYGKDPSIMPETRLWTTSPWLDHRLNPIDGVIKNLEAQKHRRFIKTHLALDGLRYFPQIKYIMVGRDPRDVFMSYWNHYSNYTPAAYEEYNGTPGRVGAPLPHCPDDIHELWRHWIARGWFEWESEGYPFWGNMHHNQSWWNFRHLDNLHLIHYNDLLTDLPGEIRRIADYLDISIPDSAITAMLPDLTLDAMRRNGAQTNPRLQKVWQNGPQTFFFKGSYGRWKEVLSEDELAQYEATASKVLTPECRAWLENGRAAMTESVRQQRSTLAAE